VTGSWFWLKSCTHCKGDLYQDSKVNWVVLDSGLGNWYKSRLQTLLRGLWPSH
jgi:hypothetical protein